MLIVKSHLKGKKSFLQKKIIYTKARKIMSMEDQFSKFTLCELERSEVCQKKPTFVSYSKLCSYAQYFKQQKSHLHTFGLLGMHDSGFHLLLGNKIQQLLGLFLQ